MGRKKIPFQLIGDDKIRHVTFKKRRLGVLRKAMQLSRLTGAKVSLKIYWHEDESFIEYFGHTETDLNHITQHSPFVDEYALFLNQHYDFVEQVDDRSECPSTGEASDRLWWAQIR